MPCHNCEPREQIISDMCKERYKRRMEIAILKSLLRESLDVVESNTACDYCCSGGDIKICGGHEVEVKLATHIREALGEK